MAKYVKSKPALTQKDRIKLRDLERHLIKIGLHSLDDLNVFGCVIEYHVNCKNKVPCKCPCHLKKVDQIYPEDVDRVIKDMRSLIPYVDALVSTKRRVVRDEKPLR